MATHLLEQTDHDGNIHTLVGKLICEGLFSNSQFNHQTERIAKLLDNLADPTSSIHLRYSLGMFAHYLKISYKAAKVIDLVSSAADKHTALAHTFLLEAVIHLNCAKRFITHDPIIALIGKEISAKINEAFTEHFPRTADARDALVHEDERVLGLVKKKSVGTSVDAMQFTMLGGTNLKVKDQSGIYLFLVFIQIHT
jgi:hypothetical protein